MKEVDAQVGWFNHSTGEYDSGPAEKTAEAYLPYIGNQSAEAIFKIRVEDQGYDILHAYVHVMEKLVGGDYPLTDEHKVQQ